MLASSQNTKTAIEYAVPGIWKSKLSNHFRTFLIVGMLALGLAGTSAIAEPLDDAKAAFERSDFATKY